MYSVKKIAGQLTLLVAAMLVLAACGAPATPASPTVDTNLIYTAAAQTVAANLTEEAKKNPTATHTPEPTATLSVPTANTNLPTLPVPAAGTPAAAPNPAALVATLTPMGALPAAPVAASKVEFQWVSNDPADNTVIEAGTKFDIAWTIKNVGKNTATTGYYYAHFSGQKFFEKAKYNFPAEVKPGETITVLVDAVAPSKSGTYFTWWKIFNDKGERVGDMDVTIVVVQAGETAVPTTSASATATP